MVALDALCETGRSPVEKNPYGCLEASESHVGSPWEPARSGGIGVSTGMDLVSLREIPLHRFAAMKSRVLGFKPPCTIRCGAYKTTSPGRDASGTTPVADIRISLVLKHLSVAYAARDRIPVLPGRNCCVGSTLAAGKLPDTSILASSAFK